MVNSYGTKCFVPDIEKFEKPYIGDIKPTVCYRNPWCKQKVTHISMGTFNRKSRFI